MSTPYESLRVSAYRIDESGIGYGQMTMIAHDFGDALASWKAWAKKGAEPDDDQDPDPDTIEEQCADRVLLTADAASILGWPTVNERAGALRHALDAILRNGNDWSRGVARDALDADDKAKKES